MIQFIDHEISEFKSSRSLKTVFFQQKKHHISYLDQDSVQSFHKELGLLFLPNVGLYGPDAPQHLHRHGVGFGHGVVLHHTVVTHLVFGSCCNMANPMVFNRKMMGHVNSLEVHRL